MAIITQQFLAAVMTNFSAIFNNIFMTGQTGVPSLCLETESTTEMESYNWLGSHPRMREWTDERKPAGATSNNFVIRARDWEASIEVDRDAFLFDKLNLIKPRVAGLAHEAQRHPRELAMGLLPGGFTTAAWDGVNFFGDHTKGGKKMWLNNNLGGIALDANGIATAFATLMAALDDRGRPLDPELTANNTFLVVGPKLNATAKALLNSEFFVGAIGGGAAQGGGAGTLPTNIWKGSASLMTTAYITDHSWFLVWTGDADARPLIFQWHKKPELTQLTNPNTSEAVFMRKKYYYGADSIYNVGYANFAQAVGSQVA